MAKKTQKIDGKDVDVKEASVIYDEGKNYVDIHARKNEQCPFKALYDSEINEINKALNNIIRINDGDRVVSSEQALAVELMSTHPIDALSETFQRIIHGTLQQQIEYLRGSEVTLVDLNEKIETLSRDLESLKKEFASKNIQQSIISNMAGNYLKKGQHVIIKGCGTDYGQRRFYGTIDKYSADTGCYSILTIDAGVKNRTNLVYIQETYGAFGPKDRWIIIPITNNEFNQYKQDIKAKITAFGAQVSPKPFEAQFIDIVMSVEKANATIISASPRMLPEAQNDTEIPEPEQPQNQQPKGQ